MKSSSMSLCRMKSVFLLFSSHLCAFDGDCKAIYVSYWAISV